MANVNWEEMAEKLRQARKLIDLPEHWIQWRLATNSDGKDVLIDSDEAVRFCASGSCYRVAGSFGVGTAMVKILDDAVDTITGGQIRDVISYNNAHDHASVLKVFDLAIATAGGRPSARF